MHSFAAYNDVFGERGAGRSSPWGLVSRLWFDAYSSLTILAGDTRAIRVHCRIMVLEVENWLNYAAKTVSLRNFISSCLILTVATMRRRSRPAITALGQRLRARQRDGLSKISIRFGQLERLLGDE
jgi:hypothetical protein